MERLKELGFGIASVGIGVATAGVFGVIAWKHAAYIYENNPWILYTELTIAILYSIWAVERLAQDLRK